MMSLQSRCFKWSFHKLPRKGRRFLHHVDEDGVEGAAEEEHGTRMHMHGIAHTFRVVCIASSFLVLLFRYLK